MHLALPIVSLLFPIGLPKQIEIPLYNAEQLFDSLLLAHSAFRAWLFALFDLPRYIVKQDSYPLSEISLQALT